MRLIDLTGNGVQKREPPKKALCVFIATFADHIVTRTPFPRRCYDKDPAEALDWAKMHARVAYKRRIGKAPPAFASAYIEVGPHGQRTAFRSYSAAELIDIVDDDVERAGQQSSNRALTFALGVVRAAGFKVSKPRANPEPKSKGRMRRTFASRRRDRKKDAGLRAAVARAGSCYRLAKALGLTPSAVLRWQRVPLKRVIQVEQVTGIRREALRPDLYQ
jgi:hypothetical protein